MSAVLFAASLLAWTNPAVLPREEIRPAVSRRFAVASAASAAFAAAVMPGHAATLPGITPSKMLTIGQYLNDVRDARAGVLTLPPLLETGTPGFEKVRVELRKPPANGIRKAASKVLTQLEGTELYSAKSALYEGIKASLSALDDGCRVGTVATPAEMVAEAEKLAALLDTFGNGFPAKYAAPDGQ